MVAHLCLPIVRRARRLRGKVIGVRTFAFVALLAACSAPAHTGGGGQPPAPTAAEAPRFPATRWVPGAPTYALSSTKITDIQRTVRDAIASFGLLGGVTESDVGHAMSQVLGLDPLVPDNLRQAGIDPDGGFAMFSDDLDPTISVHLTDPAAFAAFIDKQRAHGMVSQSVVVDGIEQFTFKSRDVGLSWAVVGDWLLVHLLIPGIHDDNKTWLTASTHRAAPTWMDTWRWANRVGEAISKAPSVLGIVDLRKLIAASARGADGIACVQLLAPVEHVGFAIDGDGTSARGRVAFDLGASAAKIYGAAIWPPQGWDIASKDAPISIGWNLDIDAFARWAEPCTRALGMGQLNHLTQGIRAGRAFASKIDIKDTSGVGALAVDGDMTILKDQLDRVPMRGSLEKDRTWNGVHGKHLGIPFGPAFDYVLDDKHAVVAMGDGVMDKVFANDKPMPRLAYLDVIPGGIPHDVWDTLFGMAGLGKRSLAMFERWRDGHISLSLDGNALVLEACGNRR